MSRDQPVLCERLPHMPWIPELFSAPVLDQYRRQAAADARAAAPVPYFAGVRSGETDALLQSFAGEPEMPTHRSAPARDSDPGVDPGVHGRDRSLGAGP
jgi:hypothetical protein